MTLIFFNYSLIFLTLFFTLLFIILTNKVINLIISLMFSSFLICVILLKITYEYLAFIYLIIYFGAILIFFLFVVMLLDIDSSIFITDYYIDKNIVFLGCVFIKACYVWKAFLMTNFISVADFSEFFLFFFNLNLTFSIFEVFLVFFSYYWIWLLLIGLVLLVVMVGLVNTLTDVHIAVIKLFKHENKKKNKNI